MHTTNSSLVIQLTMQNAVLEQFPDAISTYRFTNRAIEMLFSRECFEWCKERVMGEFTVFPRTGMGGYVDKWEVQVAVPWEMGR
jgi:nicotinate phosphoribosyltransferase